MGLKNLVKLMAAGFYFFYGSPGAFPRPPSFSLDFGLPAAIAVVVISVIGTSSVG